MSTFLTVLGSIVVGVVLTLVLLFLALKLWIHWEVRKIAAGLDGVQPIVARISLQPLKEALTPQVQALVQKAEALGYREVGVYRVPEMPDVALWAGVHAEDGTAAAVYQHSTLTPWFDLARVYQDYSTDTVSSSVVHNPKNTRPGAVMIADPTLSPVQAQAQLRQLPLRDTQLVVAAESFVDAFERCYERSMEHILLNTVDLDDIQRVREQFGGPQDMSEAQLQMALLLSQEARKDALQGLLLDRFAQSGQLSAWDLRTLDGRIVAIHAQMSDGEAQEAALAYSETNPEASEITALTTRFGGAPLDLFAAINALLPTEAAHRLLGEIQAPIRAQFYETPD